MMEEGEMYIREGGEVELLDRPQVSKGTILTWIKMGEIILVLEDCEEHSRRFKLYSMPKGVKGYYHGMESARKTRWRRLTM